MLPKMTQEDFIARSKSIHGDKYDYSQVVYVNSSTKVAIKCNHCGNIFYQSPNVHLKKCGCPMCNQRHFSIVCGMGINDLTQEIHQSKGKTTPVYRVWHGMLFRCSKKNTQETYNDCSVCDEWLRFSNFKRWFDENYIDGFQLDKDILVKCNKVYSPETCCFVPPEINVLLTKRQNDRGEYPIGVFPNGKRFSAKVNVNGKSKYLGIFDTVEDAFQRYKQAKEEHLKELAKKYFKEGKIKQNVYNALMNYKVEITD